MRTQDQRDNDADAIALLRSIRGTLRFLVGIIIAVAVLYALALNDSGVTNF